MRIEMSHIKKAYGDKVILEFENLTFEHGRIHGVVGDNGVGKTTLLKIIAGLDSANQGILRFDGLSLSPQLIKRITYVGPTPYLLKGSVFYNVAYPLLIRGYCKNEVSEKVEKILNELGIYKFRAANAGKLSAGESQKVVLARALVFEPEVLLLDEPTANIDRETIQNIEWSIKERNQKTGMTVLVISHNQEQINRLCDTILHMKKGKIECTKLELLQQATRDQKENVRMSAADS